MELTATAAPVPRVSLAKTVKLKSMTASLTPAKMEEYVPTATLAPAYLDSLESTVNQILMTVVPIGVRMVGPVLTELMVTRVYVWQVTQVITARPLLTFVLPTHVKMVELVFMGVADTRAPVLQE